MGELKNARCARCGHYLSFHSQRVGAPCKAVGCKGGPNGWTCPGFVPEEEDAALSEVG